jgi:glyoxylate reductase
MPIVAVTRGIPEAGLGLLRAVAEVRVWPEELPPGPEQLAELLHGCDGALTMSTDRISSDLLDHEPQLKVISNFAVGLDNVDVAAATARGVAVCNTPGVLTETTADAAFALLMASARRLNEGVDYVKSGHWRTWMPMLLLGQDVYRATLGIVGFGRIGQSVTRRARGFDMRVLYYSNTRRPDVERELGAEYRPFDELLREADFVSLHIALTPQTRHLIGARELKLMQPGAILINTARGPVVDTDALVQALRAGEIGGAALDVTDPEPLPADHPLLRCPNAIVVPHIASASRATRDRMADLSARNLLAVLRGERPPSIANPEVLERVGGKE